MMIYCAVCAVADVQFTFKTTPYIREENNDYDNKIIIRIVMNVQHISIAKRVH